MHLIKHELSSKRKFNALVKSQTNMPKWTKAYSIKQLQIWMKWFTSLG